MARNMNKPDIHLFLELSTPLTDLPNVEYHVTLFSTKWPHFIDLACIIKTMPASYHWGFMISPLTSTSNSHMGRWLQIEVINNSYYCKVSTSQAHCYSNLHVSQITDVIWNIQIIRKALPHNSSGHCNRKNINLITVALIFHYR